MFYGVSICIYTLVVNRGLTLHVHNLLYLPGLLFYQTEQNAEALPPFASFYFPIYNCLKCFLYIHLEPHQMM